VHHFKKILSMPEFCYYTALQCFLDVFDLACHFEKGLFFTWDFNTLKKIREV